MTEFGCKHPLALWLRFAAYTLAVGAFTTSLPLLAAPDADLFRENGPIEWLQFAAIASSAALLGAGARRFPRWREGLLCLAMAAALACVRELDGLLDDRIAVGGWKLPFAAVLLGGGVALVRHRSDLISQLSEFSQSRAFVLVWIGFIIVVPFGQLVGHGAFLEALMLTDYSHAYKRAIEEICESFGYLIVLAGTLEARIWVAERAAAAGAARVLEREEVTELAAGRRRAQPTAVGARR